MKELPCRNCITLTICKSIHNEIMNKPNVTLKRYVAIGALMNRCSMIQDYIYDDDKISNDDSVKKLYSYMMEE